MRIEDGRLVWGLNDLKPEYRKKGYEPYYFAMYLLSSKNRKALKKLGHGPISFYKLWYDHPHCVLNLYFIQLGWFTQFTTDKGCFK